MVVELSTCIVYTFSTTFNSVECQCASIGAVTCDAVSGVCQCLPGATGENCDQCLDGWIKVPGEGCQGKNNVDRR